MIRYAALGVVAVTLTACGVNGVQPSQPAPNPPRLVTAQSPGPVMLDIPGRVDSRSPVVHVPPRSWLPVSSLVDEGSQVSAGDRLVTYDGTQLRRDLSDRVAEIAQADASLTRLRLDRQRRIEEMEQYIQLVDLDAGVRKAQISERGDDERSGRELAALQRNLAAEADARAAKRLASVEALVARGRLPAQNAVRSRAAREQAALRLAAAERACREWDEGTPAIERRRLELALERCVREQHGGASIHRRFELLQRQLDGQIHQAELDRMRLEKLRQQQSSLGTGDPAITARASGVVRFVDKSLKVGSKLPVAPCVLVLDDRSLVVEARIPDHMRDLVGVWSPTRPAEGRVTFIVPDLGDRQFAGRILSISAAPAQDQAGEGRSFAAVVIPDQGPIPGMLPGMEVRCLIPVAASGGTVIPRWAIHGTGDPRSPEVILPDGARRVVHGVEAGDLFLALTGLQPGDRVAVLTGRNAVSQGSARRISGIVEAVDRTAIRLSSGFWSVSEVLPDGAPVVAGQVVARLVKNAWWLSPELVRIDVEVYRLKAEAERAVSRLNAEAAQADAAKAWRDADLDLRQARLEAQGASISATARRDEGALAARIAAEVQAQEAEARVVAAGDPRLRVAFSGNQLADLRLSAVRARAAADRAALMEVSQGSGDLLSSLNAGINLDLAEERAVTARTAWLAARLAYAQAIDAAEARHAAFVAWIDRFEAELDDEEVTAPCSGRLLHRSTAPLVPGSSIRGLEPLAVVPDPVDGRSVPRRLALEVPAHRAGQWRAGQEVAVVVPGAGRYQATVRTVATWYGTSRLAREAIDGGDESAAVDEQVFNLELEFMVPAQDADRVLPGMVAYVE